MSFVVESFEITSMSRQHRYILEMQETDEYMREEGRKARRGGLMYSSTCAKR